MSSQCEGKTKSGARCKNKTRNESKRCHLHVEVFPVEEVPVVATPVAVTAAPIPAPVVEKKKNLSEQSSDKSKKVDCCVCMEEMPKSDNLDCGHSVCRGCIAQLRNDTCPMCRREIKAKHIKNNDKKKMKERFQQDRVSRQTQATQQFLQAQQQVQALQPHFIVYIHHH